MKMLKNLALTILVGIIGFMGISSINAKSYEYIINGDTGQYVSFTKYECEDNTHSALIASALKNPVDHKITIYTYLIKGRDATKLAFDDHSHIYRDNDAATLKDEWNWAKSSTKELTIKSVNATKGSSLTGRLYLNNGVA